MTELLTTIVITASSALLLCYWFRYTCLLMLHTKTTRDYALEIAIANELSFATVQSKLSELNADLDPLRDSLDRDYALVRSLLAQAAAGQTSVEQHMLALNYRLMRACYFVGSHFSPRAARQALEEMSLVVAHFANSVGEVAAASA